MQPFPKRSFSPSAVSAGLLVTSAFHMPRAIGVFRKAGFPIVPYPVDWRTRGAEDMMRPFAVMSDGLQRSDTLPCTNGSASCSSELFPGPTQDALLKAVVANAAPSSALP